MIERRCGDDTHVDPIFKKLTKAVKCYKIFNQNGKQIIDELTTILKLDYKFIIENFINEKEF